MYYEDAMEKLWWMLFRAVDAPWCDGADIEIEQLLDWAIAQHIREREEKAVFARELETKAMGGGWISFDWKAINVANKQIRRSLTKAKKARA